MLFSVVGCVLIFTCLCVSMQEMKDVVFIVDRSDSLSDSDVDDTIEFLYNVTEWLSIGENNTLISLISYSDDVREEFPFGTFQNKTELLNGIMNLQMSTNGGTFTFDALNFVLNSSFNEQTGSRPDADKVIVVVTDGESSNFLQTVTAATEIRTKLNATIFSIGVGDGRNQDELNAIASDPDSYYAMSIEDYEFLCNLVPSLVLKLDPSVNASLSEGCPIYVQITTTFKPKLPPTTSTTLSSTTQTMTQTSIEDTSSNSDIMTTVIQTEHSTDNTQTTDEAKTSPFQDTLPTTSEEHVESTSIYVTNTNEQTTQPHVATKLTTLNIFSTNMETTTEEDVISTTHKIAITNGQTTQPQATITTMDIFFTDMETSSETSSGVTNIPMLTSNNSYSDVSTADPLFSESQTNQNASLNIILLSVILGLSTVIMVILLFVCLRRKYSSKKTEPLTSDEFMVRQYTTALLGPSKPLPYRKATLKIRKIGH